MVVFPSWLPFFLYDSSRKTHTQRNTKRAQSPQDAKQNAAHAKKQDVTQYAATKDEKVYTKSLNKLKARLGISAAHAPNLS